jgi:hypothetical protein
MVMQRRPARPPQADLRFRFMEKIQSEERH